MPEMHLRQPGFMYRACGPFTKNKERIQKKRRFTWDLIRTGSDFVIKHLIVLIIRDMIDINVYLLDWFINLLITSLLVVMLKAKVFQTNN